MAGLLVCFRFCVFVTFVICNAIICSVGVWNISFTESTGYNHQISIYLIFLGAFSLLCVSPIVFIDLVRKNAITSHIWFECSWVALFWVMELCGAAAVSADMSNVMCSAHVQKPMVGACTSTKVLMAFTWICTGTLLVYLVALTTAAIFHQSVDRQIWHATARDFAWFATRSSLGSVPASPVADKGYSLPVVTPQPQRPMPPTTSVPWQLYSHDAEPASVQRPPQVHQNNPTRQAYVTAAVPAVISTYQRPTLPKISTVPSLYPEHMGSAIPSTAGSSLLMQSALVEPLPLGDWPQRKLSDQRTKRKPPPLLLAGTAPVQVVETNSSVAQDNLTAQPPASRFGSQRQRREVRRPPPLNLSRIGHSRV